LAHLECQHNKLTELPALPLGIFTVIGTYTMNCSDNQLTVLPELPNSMMALTCNNNQLTSLPKLPILLTRLECQYNVLTELPELPYNLDVLNCSNNKIEKLPKLPPLLKHIECHHNLLTVLPPLPEKFISMNCSENQITLYPRFSENVKTRMKQRNAVYIFIQNNPANECIDLSDVGKSIDTIHNFRELYYCLRFKQVFRRWLWEKIRLPKIMCANHPDLLGQLLADENMDADEFQHKVERFGQ
jgi:Leucine-rich repeat (LRR) protein